MSEDQPLGIEDPSVSSATNEDGLLERTNFPDWSRVALVGCSGLFGGIVSYLYAWTTDVGPLGHAVSVWVSVPLYGFGGIAAALIGVFLLANTDRKDIIRLGVTGLVSGLFWIQIFQQAQNTISTGNTGDDALQVYSRAVQMETENEASDEGVASLLEANIQLMKRIQMPEEKPEVKEVVSGSVLRSAEALEKVRDKNPVMVQSALSKIAELAGGTNLRNANEIKRIAEFQAE